MPKKKPAHLSPVQGNPAISMSNLDLSDIEEIAQIQDLVYKAAQSTAEQVLRSAFVSENTWTSLPVMWGRESDGYHNTGVEDPLTVYIGFGDLSDKPDPPTYHFSVRDLIRQELADYSPCGDMATEGLRSMSATLRMLADEIDLALQIEVKD